MSNKIKSLLKDNSKYKSLFIGIKFIVVIIIIIMILQGIILYFLTNNNNKIVGITDDGIPLELEKKEKSMSNLVNVEQFTRNFIGLMYNWNYETYKRNIEEATPLMGKKLRKQYLEEIEEGGYIDQVKDYKITSSFTIRQVDENNIRKYKDGYKILVKGYKLEITDFIDRKKPIQIEIAIRPTKLNDNNIWGLEVFEIKEESK